MIWRCPRCRGELAEIDEGVACEVCGINYQSFEGIPDLRVGGPSWVDHERDRAQARQFMTETAGFSAEETVRYVFEWSRMDEAWRKKRTRQVMQASKRFTGEIEGWLHFCLDRDAIFLEVGCGSGQFLIAAAAAGYRGIGIDVRLVWLLAAKRMIADAGGTPVLAAAMAEALPLADESIQAVVSLDVIEHVGDVPAYLREIDRVTAPGRYVALATPNRFSLTAEPHIGVWGVGWVPRRWQKRYVKFRSGLSYEFVRLLSVKEARRLFRRHTRIDVAIIVPEIPETEIARFPRHRKILARFYNCLVRWKLLNPLFRLIGPFFRIVGRKEARSSS
jgi:SAM-dependent methyltransferase